MSKRKLKIQTLIFDVNFFPNRRKVKSWVLNKGYTIDKRKKVPILRCDKTFRCRQRNCDWFNKKTFKQRKLDKGVKGIFGYMKK